MTYFVPVSDRELSGILNFNRWEQAFQVFSNIYTKAYPQRATELIQYNQVIFSASQSFVWENVYQYDKELRLHLSNYSHRSWGVILQQAWSMCLKDRVHSEDNPRNHQGKYKREAFKRYNKEICTAGSSCKYDHRCTVPDCGKFGHGAHICRKRKQQNVNSNPQSNKTQGGDCAHSHNH